MKAYLNKVRWLFSGSRSEQTIAEITASPTISGATIIPESEGHVLQIDFSERINDGNEIQGISLLQDGQSIYRDALYPGETQYKIQFDGFRIAPEQYEIVLTDSNNQVVETAELSIKTIQTTTGN